MDTAVRPFWSRCKLERPLETPSAKHVQLSAEPSARRHSDRLALASLSEPNLIARFSPPAEFLPGTDRQARRGGNDSASRQFRALIAPLRAHFARSYSRRQKDAKREREREGYHRDRDSARCGLELKLDNRPAD